MPNPLNAEQKRLQEALEKTALWKRWGPYLSEREWGTVREDYSADGTAWEYFPHDHARSRAYRWGEDGIGGICDHHQRICVAFSLWNGRDPILKERLFGLTDHEGNHGEDVKEYYFYVDSTPTHSYMKFLYKYPQAEFPYAQLVQENRRRTKNDPEFELIDTGVFNENRYFDVWVEYAKPSPEEFLIRINASNRGPEAAPLWILPSLWFRNRWSWGEDPDRPRVARAAPPLQTVQGALVLEAQEKIYGKRWLICEGAPPLLFTENETNFRRIFNSENRTPYVKDAFNEYIVNRNTAAVNPAEEGTRAAAVYKYDIQPGANVTVRLRFTDRDPKSFSTQQWQIRR